MSRARALAKSNRPRCSSAGLQRSHVGLRRPRLHRSHRFRFARGLALAAVLLTAVAGSVALGPVAAGSSSGKLESRIAASQAREGELHAGIGADTHQIAGFQGNIDDLQTRLDALESSLETERDVLAELRAQLRGARARLASLQVQ